MSRWKFFVCVTTALSLFSCSQDRAANAGPLPGDDAGLADASEAANDAGMDDAGVMNKDGGAHLASVGAPCRRDGDCQPIPGGARCVTEAEASSAGRTAPGGVCTSANCNNAQPSETCGLATVCGTLGGLRTSVCQTGCSDDRDCRTGFICVAGGCAPGFEGAPDGGNPHPTFPTRWGPPTPIVELNKVQGTHWVPAVSEDLLRICYQGNQGSGEHIFCAERTSTSAPFGTPARVTAVPSGSTQETVPSLWNDVLYFTAQVNGNMDVYRARWNTSSHAYESPAAVTELNTPGRDDAPTLARDGLSGVMVRQAPGGNADLLLLSRATTSSSFDPPTPIAVVNSDSNEWMGTLTPDLQSLVFTSDRATSWDSTFAWISHRGESGWLPPEPLPVDMPAGWHIRQVRPLSNGWLVAGIQVGDTRNDQRADDQLAFIPPRDAAPQARTRWGTPVPLTELNSTGEDYHSTMTRDGLRICFASTRPESNGSDIYCARRTKTTLPFDAPQRQVALDTDADEFEPFLSPDGAELYFDRRDATTNHTEVHKAAWNASTQAYEGDSVGGPNTTGFNTQSASVSSDGLVMVYATEVLNDLGIYLSTRPALAMSFNVGVQQREPAMGHDDFEPRLSPDGFTLLFCSSRPSCNWQPLSMWASARTTDGHWGEPVQLSIDGQLGYYGCGSQILPDGSLLFHSSTPGDGIHDHLYIAPPAEQ